MLDIRSVYDFDGRGHGRRGASSRLRTRRAPPPAQRPARFLRLEKAVGLPDDEVLDLPGFAFGVSAAQLHARDPRLRAGRAGRLGARAGAGQRRRSRSRCSTPTAGASRRVTTTGCRCAPARCVSCNGCHDPADGRVARTARSVRRRQCGCAPPPACLPEHRWPRSSQTRRDHGAGPRPHQLPGRTAPLDPADRRRAVRGRLDRPGAAGAPADAPFAYRYADLARPRPPAPDCQAALERRTAASRSTTRRTSTRCGACRARPSTRWAVLVADHTCTPATARWTRRAPRGCPPASST